MVILQSKLREVLSALNSGDRDQALEYLTDALEIELDGPFVNSVLAVAAASIGLLELSGNALLEEARCHPPSTYVKDLLGLLQSGDTRGAIRRLEQEMALRG